MQETAFKPTSSLARWRGLLLCPPRSWEIGTWVLLLAAILWPRIYLEGKLPFYLWSKDAISYSASALRWMDGEGWVTDPRRGPVYSMLIAATLKLWGSFRALMTVQHVIGGFSVLLGMITLRQLFGRSALIAFLLCSYAYAVYAGPISMEHIVRNDILLFLFSTVALSSWLFGLRSRHAAWFGLCGLSLGLLSLTKNVFVPMPLLVLGSLAWMEWRRWGRALLSAGLFLAMFAAPFVGNKIVKARSKEHPAPQPQSGLLLYARVAQFTVLNGGIEPEIKELIRPDIEAYIHDNAEDGDLDNNVVLNRTAIPHMRTYLLEHGQTPTDLNRLCMRLAREAILAHPKEYARQVAADWVKLHLQFGDWIQTPDDSELKVSLRNLSRAFPHRLLNVEQTLKTTESITGKGHLNGYRRIVNSAWLFQYRPVLLTSVLIPFLCWLAPKRDRAWWLGCALLWYFSTVLLATFGKPMNRYLLPVTPIMFWTMSSCILLLWGKVLSLFAQPGDASLSCSDARVDSPAQ